MNINTTLPLLVLRYCFSMMLDCLLQPDEEAHVTVLSTCPCERDLHYVVTTEGHITYWSQALRPDSLDEAPPTQIIDGAAICKHNFR
jgi:hypothetical protein